VTQILLEHGPAFLKAIIDHTYTSTLANTAKARENLVSLKEYMESLPDSNITEFNQYVKKQLEMLAAGGEMTNDLITNLFKGYSHAKDKDFCIWIVSKKQACFDKTFQINANGLDFMELVENYYKDARTAGEWMQPDNEQKTILALQAKDNKFEAKAAKIQRREGKRKPDKKNKIKNKYQDKDWAWKKIPPKEGEDKTKQVSGNAYHWCRNHKQWSIHKPSECLLKSGDIKNTSRQTKKEKDKDLKLKVYQAALESSSGWMTITKLLTNHPMLSPPTPIPRNDS
jgi:hypothetical protein